jgi:hypothetical protein
MNLTRIPKLEAPDRLEHWPLNASRSLSCITEDAAAADPKALSNQASEPLKHLELRNLGLMLRIGLMAAWIGGAATEAAEPTAADGERLRGLLGEVQELQSRQSFMDALLKLEAIEKAFPDAADVYTMRGSIQLAPSIRDFAAAEASFVKAAALSPGVWAPMFNLAELPFVKHDWKEAKARFEGLLTAFPQMPLAMRHLVHFKMLVCQLKLNDVQAAEAVLAANFTFMDDTPAYYMAKAAMAFNAKNDSVAREWLEKARGIFGDQPLVSYLDSLMEARWIPNIGLPRVSIEVTK